MTEPLEEPWKKKGSLGDVLGGLPPAASANDSNKTATNNNTGTSSDPEKQGSPDTKS